MDTTQVIIWIVIILVAILIIWLLRKWIKRLIFIIVILGLAFFIFGLFNPSGASRLRYNVKTFPDRVVSRFSNQTFVDYDNYLSPKTEEVGDKIDFNSDNDEQLNSDNTDEGNSSADEEKNEKNEIAVETTGEELLQSCQSFSSSFNNLNLPEMSESVSRNNSDEKVMKALEEYLGRNLDENTDVLVTLEYLEDGDKPEKIILKTQEKTHFAAVQRIQRKSAFAMARGVRKNDDKSIVETVSQSDVIAEQKSVSQNSSKTYNGLTQKEVRETEELFSILFD